MNPAASAPRPRGRPRRFDRGSALEAAMKAFWSAGYDGASVDMMCRAMNMSRASLYQSYGGKDGLFLAVIAHYIETRIAPVAAALGPHGSLEEDLTSFYSKVVQLATADPETPGCLISCVLADAAGTNLAFREELDRRFSALEIRIGERFRLAHWRADASVTASDAAGLAAAMARGLMLRARSGQSAADLMPIAAAAVSALTQISA